ncbi:MAG: acetate/propionate family kinase, partial [Verrucomicrobia bacterium]|nr:acetate/propionate family kinase [Verrucomicrobiota bacterium]
DDKNMSVLAHLGSGASMAAVKDGKSIDTSMGFTPASGIMMGTRPGDLDPGVSWYIIKLEQLSPKQFSNLINHESGLLGISETSSDMHDLLASGKKDIRAEEAITLFCYQAKKWIGAFAAALGGLDTLVFAGGIGENSPIVRSRICEGLEFLGIKLDEKQNETNAPVISAKNGKAVVRVIHTDEEEVIAKAVSQKINA